MLDIAFGKSGHSSARLNVNLTFQFLECTMPQQSYHVIQYNKARNGPGYLVINRYFGEEL